MTKHLIEIHEDQLASILRDDIDTLLSNAAKDIKRHGSLDLQEAISNLALCQSMNDVIEYCGGEPVDIFKRLAELAK